MDRHEFLKTLATAAISIVAPRASRGEQPTVPMTHTYKTAGGCEIRADAYGADASVRKPVVVWIHGGALMVGSRKHLPEWLDTGGACVAVSIDYRLAPETKLPAIVQDVQDAFRWVRDQGPRLFNIDPERLVVAGASAGGYLTLMTGFCVNPRPKALLSLSGYGDIAATWYTRPSPFYLQRPLVSKEDALASVGTVCISEPAEKNERGRFYLYCRQRGIWPKEVSGHDPDLQPKWFDRYCPVRNVSANYPPTVLIHGTADTDVPYEESVKMDEALSRFKVEHKFLSVTGGTHVLGRFNPAVRARVLQEGVAFLREHAN